MAAILAPWEALSVGLRVFTTNCQWFSSPAPKTNKKRMLDPLPGFNNYHKATMNTPPPVRLRADFNGLFSQLLCLSHKETCEGENGQDVIVHEGMIVTVFDEDADDEGKPGNLVASGRVERSPAWLRCNGSRWVLRIDENGVRHESDLRKTQ